MTSVNNISPDNGLNAFVSENNFFSVNDSEERDESNIFQEFYSFFSIDHKENNSDLDYEQELQKKLEELGYDLEQVTRKLNEKIAETDVDSESGVQNILEYSDRLELSTEIKNKITSLLQELGNINGEIGEELQTQIDTLLDEAISTLNFEELQDLSDKGFTVDTANLTNLDEAQMIDIVDYEAISNIDAPELLDGLQLENLDLDLESLKQELSQAIEANVNSIETLGESPVSNFVHNFNTINTSSSELYSSPVKVTKLPEFLFHQVDKPTADIKEELRIILNPENLGKVDMTIAKDGDNVNIRFMVAKDQALEQIQARVVDIKNMLESKGFKAEIEVSKSDSSRSSGDSQASPDHSDNEAREEQKKRFINTTPEWLENSESFELPSSSQR